MILNYILKYYSKFNVIQLFRIKIFLFLVLIFIIPQIIYSKIGIGYFFKDKLLLKKFYINSKTHFIEIPKKRYFKSQKIFLNKMKLKTSNFTGIISSLKFIKLDESTQKKLFNEKEYYQTKNYHKSNLEKKYHLSADFKNPYFMFVEFIPKTKIILPKWIKSISFYAKGNTFPLTFMFYLNNNGIKRRYQIIIKNEKWTKFFINLNDLNYKNNHILLDKIRVSKSDGIFPANLSLIIGQMKLYNYFQNQKNLYSDAYYTFADFEDRSSKYWSNNLTNIPLKLMTSLLPYDKTFIWDDNINYLSLHLKTKIHKQRDILIYFPSMLYRQKLGHQISFLIRGYGLHENISLIFKEGANRYFELEMTELSFIGWRRIRAKIPEKKIKYFVDKLDRIPYIFLIGLKISSFKKEVHFDLDQLESQLDF